MSDLKRDEWGLNTLEKEELELRAGMTLREWWALLCMLGDAVKKAEKYWPKFKEGFVAGWEEA